MDAQNAGCAQSTPVSVDTRTDHTDEARASLQELLDRVQRGVPGAAEQLHEKYGAHILRVVRRRLPRRLRPKFDSLDFVQEVWAAFYRTPGRHFHEPDHLIAFLTRTARNKVNDAAGGMHRAKRDLRREQSLPLGPDGQPPGLLARDATPSENAIGHELWEQMLEGQPPAYRHVLNLLREGQTKGEVAKALNLHLRTVQRILSRALERTGHEPS